MRAWKIVIFVGLFTMAWYWTATKVQAESATASAGIQIPIPNPGFEEGVAGEMATGYGGMGKIILDNPHSGKHCIQQEYVPGHTWNCIQLLPPYIKSGENKTYELSAWCRNTVASGEICLGVRSIDVSKTKTIKYNWKPVVNNVNTWQKYTLKFTTPPKSEALAVYFRIGGNVPSGEVFWDDVTLMEVPHQDELMSVEPLKSAVFFKTDKGTPINFVYYDPFWGKFIDRKVNDVVLEVKFGKKAKGLSFDVIIKEKYNNRKVISRENITVAEGQSNMNFPLKISNLSKGHYVLNAKLSDSGKIMESIDKDIIINNGNICPPPAEPIKKVEIDTNKNILVNGKPFLMVFYYHNPLREMKELNESFGASTAQVWGGSIDQLCNNVELAWQTGVYSWPALGPLLLDIKTGKLKDNILTETVNRLKNHPGMIGWYLFDEPDGAKDGEAMTRELARAVKIIRTLDPNHPILVNLCLSDKFKKYVQYSDFASYDTYPFPDMSLSVIEGNNKKIIEDSENQKPLIAVLQCWSQSGNRGPTYEELKAETFLCITQGMKIFSFYSWSDPEPQFCLKQSPELQSYVKELIFEMNVLKEFLFAPTPKQPVIKELSEKAIRFIYKNVGGKNYFITVNISDSIQEYNISLPHYKVGTPIEVLFEDGRTANLVNGGLKDILAPFEVHVYRY